MIELSVMWPGRARSARALCLSVALAGSPAIAEVVFDGSVGPGGSLFGDMEVTEAHGTRAGANLFHSFQTLNVNPGESLTFTSNFAGLTDNVISRVTGTTSSLIDGPVINSIPGASLWLINPHGIVFGAGAFVDVQGSFHASTADYLLFEDGGRFGADLAIAANTTLSIANPTAFGFIGNNIGTIELQDSGLFVPFGESLELVAGEVNIRNSFLAADGGSLGIAAVTGGGEVTVGPHGYAGADAWGDVTMVDSGAFVNGDGGGAVFIRGGQFVMDQSTLEAQTFGPEDGQGIDIDVDDMLVTRNSFIVGATHGDGRGNPVDIDATGSVTIDGGSWIDNRVFGFGDAGDIAITAGESILVDGINEFGGTTRVAGATFGPGNGAAMLLEAPNITVSNGAFLWNSARSDGHAGAITLNGSESVNLVGTTPDGFSGGIYANATQPGNAGNVTVNTHHYNQLDAGYVVLSTFGPSAGGTFTINATGDVTFAGVGTVGDPSFVIAGSFADGPAGSINVTAANMYLYDGSTLGTYSPGSADGGAINLAIDGLLEIGGNSQDLFGTWQQTRLDSTAGGGTGGPININAGTVRVVDGGIIATTSFGLGNAGSVDIIADTFESSGTTSGLTFPDGSPQWFGSGIWAVVDNPEGGTGGDVSITAGNIVLGRGGGIRTFSRARASGSITMTASERITIGGAGDVNDIGFVPPAEVDSTSDFSQEINGVGGSITMTAPDIDILSGSFIGSVAFFNDGKAGDINITADNLLNITNDLEFNPQINSEAAFGGIPGSINLSGTDVIMDGAYILTDVSFSSASAGNIRVTADNSIRLDNAAELFALTFYGESGGEIRLAAPEVSMTNGSRIVTDTYGFADNAGTIYVNAGDLTLASGSSIDANSCFCAFGGAGSIFIDVDTLNIFGTGFINVPTGIFSTALGSGDSGNININADVINMTDVAQILAYSLATEQDFIDNGEPGRIPGDAGSIEITANQLWMENSFIETSAVESAGGNLDLDINDILFVSSSFIGAQANGVDAGSNGGNIRIASPNFVILDRGNIAASANAGNGGNILIDTNAIIVGIFSDIDASSQLGVDGQVNVESPNRLVASVTPLEAPVLNVADFNEDPCEVAVERERSSFTVPGSGGVMSSPSDYQASPIIAMRTSEGGGKRKSQEEDPAACEAPVQ